MEGETELTELTELNHTEVAEDAKKNTRRPESEKASEPDESATLGTSTSNIEETGGGESLE
jgi:hypothetical protein